MTRQKNKKVRVGHVPRKESANELRKRGIESLGKVGIRVFMTKEEWENEPDEYKREWDNGWLKRVLTRGPAFRFTQSAKSRQGRSDGSNFREF